MVWKYYAVKVGENPGVYSNWKECEEQISGFPCNKYKGFNEKIEAYKFLIESDNQSNLVPIKNEKNNKLSEIKSLLAKTKKRQLENDNVEDDSLSGKKFLLDRSDSFTRKSINIKDSTPDQNSPSKNRSISFNCQPVQAYTDGACSNNGQENAKGGYGVWWADDHPLNLSEKLLGRQTNQRAELAASIAAIQQAIKYRAGELTIFTDSTYVINCITKWIPNWKKNGWLTSKKKPVENTEDIKLLDSLCLEHKQVVWKHVTGHKGIYGNERADELARNALQ